MPEVSVSSHRGWDIVQLSSDQLEVDVVPGKGGDLTSVRWLPLGVDVLWKTPWGLRPRGERSAAGGSEAKLMEAYPGGWQTVFPNAGDPTVEHGVDWGHHGEVWMTSLDWKPVGPAAIEMRTRLVRSPFEVVKRVEVDGSAVTVTETVTNDAAEAVDVMWSQHPAFGPPLVGPGTSVEAPAGVVHSADGDAAWPTLPGTGTDLRRVPPPRAGETRMAYLGDLGEGRVAVVNAELDLRAELSWDLSVMPYAWYWLEAGGRAGFPWFSDAYVLALEPATSWPYTGVSAVRETTGTHVTIEPGESRTSAVTLRLGPVENAR